MAKTAFSRDLGGKEHWSLPAGFVAALDGASPGATLRIDGSAGSQELPSGGHVRAGTELIVEVLAKQSREGVQVGDVPPHADHEGDDHHEQPAWQGAA